jgi:drug/metabolite transporter (DMT)-like permease
LNRTFSVTPRQLLLLTLVTLFWGFNWPVMKVGVSGYPPLAFRTLSMWLGLPVLWLATRVLQVDLRIARRHWRQLALLTFTNMLVWHVLAIEAVQSLSSGRAAILGYTMPIWSALWGFALFGERLERRQVLGVCAAALGVLLLLWHELGALSGRPLAACAMLVAAAVWALGTQQLRRTTIDSPTLAIVFWMTLATTLAMTLLTTLFEHDRWTAPPLATWGAIVYNGVLIFGFAQPAWLILARGLPPVASSMSVMLIPVLGTVAGAWFLKEQLHWQDGAAIVLLLVAIGAVMGGGRSEPPPGKAA